MMIYNLELTLVSELFDFDLDFTFGSDPYEAFAYYFYNHGGTELEYYACPCLKPGVDSLPNMSSFTSLSWDSENETFEGSTPNYEIVTASGDQKSGWNYTYYLLISFPAQASAESLEETFDKVRTEALTYLAIYDGGLDEIIEVEDVRFAWKSNE